MGVSLKTTHRSYKHQSHIHKRLWEARKLASCRLKVGAPGYNPWLLY